MRILAQEQGSWTSNQMIAIYIALGVVAAGVIAWLLLRKTFRTRMRMARSLRQDPDMSDWLVIFGWTPKILYVPTIIAAAAAALLMFLQESGWSVFAGIDPHLVGGIWFAIFFLNFLTEEYDLNLRLILIVLSSFGFLLLWLHLLGWVTGFLGLFGHLAFSISGTGYLLIAVIGAATIGMSWVHGLFYYVAITPNNLAIQTGPAEAGEQIGREDYSTKVDTRDFIERLLGFGRIAITFKDHSRPPISLLVWRVDRKAEMLEKVRAKFTVDHPQDVFEHEPPLPPPPAPPAPPQSDPPQATIG